ncbi:MAG: nuclear transport factor 2 family protein [Pseudomonadota bacterium]
MTPRDVVLAFWDAMQSNDFERASTWLSTDFEGHWPQSGELTQGRQAFARINTEYPAEDRWEFQLNGIVCEGTHVVTDVSVTDGTTTGRAITFHTVEDGLIARQTEFWPDPFAPPAWRADWVSVVDAPPFG